MENSTKIIIAASVLTLGIGGFILYRKRFALRQSLTNYQTNGGDMKLQVKRIKRTTASTIGELYINGKFFGYTLEDRDRGLSADMPLAEIKKIKVNGESCIPAGTYVIDMNTVSPKYQARGANSTYAKIGFKLPRLLNVPAYEGVLLHIGNYPKDTEGCLLIGESIASKGDAINNSSAAFWRLYAELEKAHKNGQRITITIV